MPYKPGILEAHEPNDAIPRSYRSKSFIKRLITHDFALQVPGKRNTYRLREGISLSRIGQMLALFEESREVWYPTLHIKFDPNARFGPALRYPLLIARRQQSFAYLEAKYA